MNHHLIKSTYYIGYDLIFMVNYDLLNFCFYRELGDNLQWRVIEVLFCCILYMRDVFK